jgi:hypothetical protein
VSLNNQLKETDRGSSREVNVLDSYSVAPVLLG